MISLSPHFSVEEFCESQTASRRGIDNSLPIELVANAKRTAAGLERVRVILNANAIRVSSGYRCEALEKELTYSDYLARCKRKAIPVTDQSWKDYFLSKDHPKAQAADITCASFGPPPKIMDAIVRSNLDYDQLILEHAGAGGGWVHISFSDKPRKQALIIDNQGTRSFA